VLPTVAQTPSMTIVLLCSRGRQILVDLDARLQKIAELPPARLATHVVVDGAGTSTSTRRCAVAPLPARRASARRSRSMGW